MLASEGRLSASISSVTWGKEDSRDVHYGKAVATRLGIAWEHIPMDAEHFLANVETMGAEMAALSYPHHLHRMTWFSQCSADTLVLAGSYGDSVGRAEYCGKHVLELSALSAFDEFGLLTPHAAAQGVHAMNSELRALRERGGGGLPEFVHCEHEQQAHYMRGGLGQVMNIINRYCQLYQAFTSPHVYTYMWALHPACRNDEIYANMLEMLPAEIARLPWARTNRALRGKTIGADERLSRNFHDYYDWSRNIVRPAYKHLMEPEWFADTGLFRLGGIERLDLDFKSSSGGVHLDEIWTYLISFRMFVESMQAAGKRVRFLDRETAYPPARIQPRNPTLVQSLVRRSRVLERLLRALRARYRARRRRMLMKWAVKKFCPREKT
jgi:asparagine synthase (glutamine-hydrolysing)